MKFILSWKMRPEKLQETINYWFSMEPARRFAPWP
jgi:hypothetical protein